MIYQDPENYYQQFSSFCGSSKPYFIPSKGYRKSKEGYRFRKGTFGLGYYFKEGPLSKSKGIRKREVEYTFRVRDVDDDGINGGKQMMYLSESKVYEFILRIETKVLKKSEHIQVDSSFPVMPMTSSTKEKEEKPCVSQGSGINLQSELMKQREEISLLKEVLVSCKRKLAVYEGSSTEILQSNFLAFKKYQAVLRNTLALVEDRKAKNFV